MEQINKIHFDALGKWAFGASLIQGVGVLSRNHMFEAGALPFHLYVLHELIRPFTANQDLKFLSAGVSAFSGFSVLTAAVVRFSDQKTLESSRTIKMAHAFNEMVVLAAFVSTVVASIFAIEARQLCVLAAMNQALCYMNRFYHETPVVGRMVTQRNSGLPEGVDDVTYMMRGRESSYLGRKEFVEDVVGILRSEFETNNPLLIGPASSGKTELIHHLACEINANRIKEFQGWKVYKTNCKKLVAGTKFVGTLPDKINKIFQFLAGKKAILFIDEIHQSLSEGRGHNTPDNSIAESLLTHLTDPNIRVIAATTPEHAQKLYENEPFRQRFCRKPMPRMTVELRNRILGDRVSKLKIRFPDVIIPENYEQLLIQCLESQGEQSGLRTLIALLSVIVEQMARKKIPFESALQQQIEEELEFKVSFFESKGLIATDAFIGNLKAKAEGCNIFGKELIVLNLVLQQAKTQPHERSMDVLLRSVPRLSEGK